MKQDFHGYAEGFGMRAAWLRQEYKRGNFTYKVAGLMVHARKKCSCRSVPMEPAAKKTANW